MCVMVGGLSGLLLGLSIYEAAKRFKQGVDRTWRGAAEPTFETACITYHVQRSSGLILFSGVLLHGSFLYACMQNVIYHLISRNALSRFLNSWKGTTQTKP